MSTSWLHKGPLKNQTNCLRALCKCFFTPGRIGFMTTSLGSLFRESQNHRTEGVGRDLKRSSGPTPLPKQVP